MKIRKLMAPITLLSFLISAPAARAWVLFAPGIPAEQTKNPRPFKSNWISNIVAQNKTQATDDGNKSTRENGSQAQVSETDDKEQSGQKTDEPDTKPLKPFRPSEEIAAEQAVDFPVDI